MKIQVVLLGPQKQPSYVFDAAETEKPKWYRICYNTTYQVGDSFRSIFDWQSAYMCPPNMEVYRAHDFEEIYGVAVDSDFVEMEDWINEHCFRLMQICDNDFEFEEEEK